MSESFALKTPPRKPLLRKRSRDEAFAQQQPSMSPMHGHSSCDGDDDSQRDDISQSHDMPHKCGLVLVAGDDGAVPARIALSKETNCLGRINTGANKSSQSSRVEGLAVRLAVNSDGNAITVWAMGMKPIRVRGELLHSGQRILCVVGDQLQLDGEKRKFTFTLHYATGSDGNSRFDSGAANDTAGVASDSNDKDRKEQNLAEGCEEEEACFYSGCAAGAATAGSDDEDSESEAREMLRPRVLEERQSVFRVRSRTGNGWHTVDTKRVTCTCGDYVHHCMEAKRTCYHIDVQARKLGTPLQGRGLKPPPEKMPPGAIVYVGPKLGRFYYNANGNKIYLDSDTPWPKPRRRS